MFLPTLSLGIFLVRLTRDFSRNFNRANVNRRQGIVVSYSAASTMAIHRFAFTIILQGISSRIRFVFYGRFRSVIFYVKAFVKPRSQYYQSSVYVRRNDYSYHYVSNMSFPTRFLTNIRRIGFEFDYSKERRSDFLQGLMANDGRYVRRDFIRIITRASSFSNEKRVCTRCEIDILRAYGERLQDLCASPISVGN